MPWCLTSRRSGNTKGEQDRARGNSELKHSENGRKLPSSSERRLHPHPPTTSAFAQLDPFGRYASIWKVVTALASTRLSAGWRRFKARREFLVFRARARAGATGLQVLFVLHEKTMVENRFGWTALLKDTPKRLRGKAGRQQQQRRLHPNRDACCPYKKRFAYLL